MKNSQTLFNARQGNVAVDVVMYVASLVSRPQEIDPILDGLRAITAKLNPGQTPNAADNEALAAVYYKIEDYLVTKEPLREFTKESIRERVSYRFDIGRSGIEGFWQQSAKQQAGAIKEPSADSKHSTRLSRIGHGIIAASLSIGLVSLFLPAVPSPEHPFSNNVGMGFSLAAALLLFGASWLFLKGLPGFKAGLKTVYRLLCLAMVLLALAQLQQVIYTQFGLWTIPFIRQGGVALGFVPPTLLFYIAMFMFARLLQVKHFSSSLIALLATSAVVAGASLVVPVPSPLPPAVLQSVLPSSLFLTTTMVFATIMALVIKKTVSPPYKPALAWLFMGLSSVGTIGLFYTAVQVLLPANNVILAYGGISFLFIATGIFMVYSAMAFNRIQEL